MSRAPSLNSLTNFESCRGSDPDTESVLSYTTFKSVKSASLRSGSTKFYSDESDSDESDSDTAVSIFLSIWFSKFAKKQPPLLRIVDFGASYF